MRLFCDYILGHVGAEIRDQVATVMSQIELGWNQTDQRVGLPFPPYAVEMQLAFQSVPDIFIDA